MIMHARQHAIVAGTACTDCGNSVDHLDEQDEVRDGWVPWEDPEILAEKADHLDDCLKEYRARFAAGDPPTTSEIAESLIGPAQMMIDDGDWDPRVAVDVVAMLAATAIQRLISGDQ